MRVLVIRNAYDKDAGGAEQYALNICLTLQQNGIDPILITRVPDVVAKAKNAGIKVHKGIWHSSQEWGKHYFWRYPLTVVWYMWTIMRFRIDVVHPQGRDDFIFATQAAHLLGKRVVWTDHADLKVVMNLQKHPFPYLRKWIIGAARHTKAIICVGKAEMAEITAVAPELTNKLVLVHNGVFVPGQIKPEPKATRYVIATNARLVPDKGISELITGFSKSKFAAQSSLWLVGGHSGNLDTYQQLAAGLGVADRVRFVGYVAHPHDFIAACDVFVHASYHEAFSLAIIEAAMLGRPIVATKVGGAPEILDQDCGILIPPKNADAITQAIDTLLTDPSLRQKLGDNAQKRAHRDFNFATIVKEKVIPLYTQ